ncbi:hypothetical protein [Mameliella sp.]|uniref:hypothetical protein n=2 Tax=Mameliella sp. TaxID=1924940 RepID=UPI003BA930DC
MQAETPEQYHGKASKMPNLVKKIGPPSSSKPFIGIQMYSKTECNPFLKGRIRGQAPRPAKASFPKLLIGFDLIEIGNGGQRTIGQCDAHSFCTKFLGWS